ncbi:MAG: dockerin type I domain-containing protein [Clostridiales bacterium]|nr:dockerin type I domain-containing protein [Clostridiales bacterium]
MTSTAKHKRRILSAVVTLAMVFGLFAGMPITASADEPDNGAAPLERFRDLFYSETFDADAARTGSQELERVYLDRSAGMHWQQKDEPCELDSGNLISARMLADNVSGPFEVGEERYFRAWIGATSTYRAVRAVLASQGEHTNVWVPIDEDWHATVTAATGNLNIHSDSRCKLPELMTMPHVLQDVATSCDGIYERMTNPVTGLGAHAEVLNLTDEAQGRYAGDFGLDGKINVLLSDTGGYWGYYESADMRTNNLLDSSGNTITTNPLDVIHVDISPNTGWHALLELESANGTKGNKLLLFGTFAHEFQHFLFNMHIGGFGLTGSGWYNEALAGLTDTFYVQEGAEVIYSPYMEGATRNNYSGTRGDLFSFGGDSKAYGMGYLHSMFMHKKTNGTYGSGVYSYLSNVGGTTAEKRAWFAGHSMDQALGAAFKHALGSQYSEFTDREAFNSLYYLFMENFAADGGTVVSQSGVAHTSQKFIIPVNATDNLWVNRHYNPTWTRIPFIASGGAVALNGFQSGALAEPGRIVLGASHEMLYAIGEAPDKDATVLEIEIPNAPGLECYVAIPSDTLGWARPGSANDARLLTGATLHHIKKGQPNLVDTNGGYAYLFTSTIFQDVNTTVAYSWKARDAASLSGATDISIHTPRYGDTLTASLAGGNSANLLYQWFAGDESKGSPSAGNTYTVAAADIGKPISVQVTAADKAGALHASTVPTLRALYVGAAAIAPVLVYKAPRTVELAPVADYEYSMGGHLWQDSPVFTGLFPNITYDFYQRVKATTTHDASAFSPALTVTTLDPGTVYASLFVDAESGIEGDVVYTLSIRQAVDLLNVELEFEIDGSLLAGKGLVGLNSFTPVSGIFWSYAGGGKWKGAATLGLPSGDTDGLTSVAPVDIAEFVFAPMGIGDAAMALTSFRAVGLDGTTVYLLSDILDSEAVTNIDQRVFSKYDLNRDNTVDALDLGIMLLYCGFDKDSPNWSTLVKVNDSRGKPVTASMCDVNGDGVIDMLDLLDLFIHYTK